MDLNHLFHSHQVALMRAHAATCDRSRAGHRADAASHALRVDSLQRERGALARPLSICEEMSS